MAKSKKNSKRGVGFLIEHKKTDSDPLRAFLVVVALTGQEDSQTNELKLELAELARTMGVEVIESQVIKIRKRHSRYLIGTGNAADIAQKSKRYDIDVIIFDDDLTPSQQRNWEKLSQIQVIDRREVILDIFAARASTREAVIQVDLARAEYLLPRMKRAWTHLSRQQGGLGLRGGEGEKQIEVDERLIRKQVAKLKGELKTVRKRRAEQRKKRDQLPVPNAAVVGYTNAGKSSLLNSLSDANTVVEDKLFATLDPTTRRITLPNNQVLLLTDTVGFVRKLPHDLIDAFKATLEEAALATFLIHVVDVTSTALEDHLLTTQQVLSEIGAGDKLIITVFNKIDVVSDPFVINRIKNKYRDGLFISTKTKQGLDQLLDAMTRIIDEDLEPMELSIPNDKYELVALLHRTSNVTQETYEDDRIYIKANIPKHCQHDFHEYSVS